ncbi:MAG: lysophospholipase [Candidatus Eiseniibacteriota bacterium]
MAGPFELSVPSGDVVLHVKGHEVLRPRGGLLIAPGFAEHAGRYARLMQELAARGFSTAVYDPRGHDRSTGPRGHTPAWSQLVEDLDRVVEALRTAGRLPERFGVLGASMGGLVALDWMLSHRERARGLVLVSPYFEAAHRPPFWKIALARLFGGLWPSFSQAHGLKGKDMTSDPVIVSLYDVDPAMTRVMSARYYTEHLNAQQRLRETAAGVDFPVLVLTGSADPIARATTGEEWARRVPSEWIEARSYPGLKHELLNELERQRVVADLGRWLDWRIPAEHRPGP